MTQPLLVLEDVTKVYGSGASAVVVLRGADLRLERGEVLRVNGASGSGKTTLINVAGLLTAPTSGRVVLGGTPVVDLADAATAELRSRDIGMVFQSHNLFPELDPVENVLLAARPERASRDAAVALLERAGLGHRLTTRAKALSGGEQQRVALARALVNEPSLLLADEPVSGLDDDNRAFVLDELAKAAAGGCAVMISSHDDAVDRIANRHVTMRQGAPA